jgi:hypothetical protein
VEVTCLGCVRPKTLLPGLLASATANPAGPTISDAPTIRTCVNLQTGNVRVIKVSPTNLQWPNGKNPSGCAKEDEQELDWTLGGGGDRPDGCYRPDRPGRDRRSCRGRCYRKCFHDCAGLHPAARRAIGVCGHPDLGKGARNSDGRGKRLQLRQRQRDLRWFHVSQRCFGYEFASTDRRKIQSGRV